MEKITVSAKQPGDPHDNPTLKFHPVRTEEKLRAYQTASQVFVLLERIGWLDGKNSVETIGVALQRSTWASNGASYSEVYTVVFTSDEGNFKGVSKDARRIDLSASLYPENRRHLCPYLSVSIPNPARGQDRRISPNIVELDDEKIATVAAGIVKAMQEALKYVAQNNAKWATEAATKLQLPDD